MTLDTLKEYVTEAAAHLKPPATVTFRAMFGGACAYVGGKVVAVLCDVGLALKLSNADRDEVLKVRGTKPLQFEPDSPPMKQYVVVPPKLCASSTELAGWLAKSVAYAKTLPAPKPRRRKKSPKSES